MQRIPAIDPAHAQGKTAELFEAVRKKMGGVPNILRTMGQSAPVLDAYLGFSGALGQGRFDPAFREQLALAVAGANACDYCASVHTAVGRSLSLSADETARNLRGEASVPKAAAGLAFAREVVRARGRVDNSELAKVRAAGFDDGEIVELLGHVALNLFTNYFNHLAETEIDFPVVSTAAAAVAA